jgi:HAMP domain-containing protein
MAFALAAMHLAAGLLALVILRRRLRRLAVLEETFRQFDKDRAWLRGNTPES